MTIEKSLGFESKDGIVIDYYNPFVVSSSFKQIETLLKAIWWLIKALFELLKNAIVAIIGFIIVFNE